MNARKVFERWCEKKLRRRRLDIEHYPNVPAAPVYARTRRLAAELITSAREHCPGLPPIHFEFIDDGRVNAFALREGGAYFIGLTAGAVTMLHLVLNRMLASPRTFPFIGTPSLEIVDVPLVPWDVINAQELFEKYSVRPVIPRDSMRHHYALHLADQAMMFLVGHEIAHITRGHVDLYASRSTSAFMAELGWHGTEDARFVRQVLEVDADARSSRTRCNSMLGTAYFNREKVPPWVAAPLSPKFWQFDWAFPVNVMFRLFGDERFSGVALERQPYPPHPMRRRITMEAMERLLRANWEPEVLADIDELVQSATRVTEFAFSVIGADASKGGMEDAFTAEASMHIEKIREGWPSVRESLEPFTYEPLDGGRPITAPPPRVL